MKRKKKRVISEEHRAKLRANIAKARAKRDENLSKYDVADQKAMEDYETDPPTMVRSPACDTVLAPVAPVPEPVEMTISYIPINGRVVLADATDGDPKQTVFVGNNATFVVGDKIRVKPYPGQPGVWDLIGQPPRDRRRVAGGFC